MRRFWIGIVLLTLLLALSILTSLLMPRLHAPIYRQLDAVSQAAQEKDWERCRSLTEDAYHGWLRCRRFTASVADHAPMEAIDSGFAQTLAFLEQGEWAEFAAACASLARSVQAMAESHSMLWWNFL